ncbi:hypothetical protein SDC9_189629 [bioreactor metagenome]|uniref:Uncharacterized protein n=1 Tax=bioreactor metagenome TaxID=1076179 RepID=A0A645I3L7_9ZZZZ
MQGGNATDNRQAQPAAGNLLSGRTIKAFANVRQDFCRDAGAVVSDRKLPGVKRDIHLATFGAVADGVIQQIAHQQTEQ